MRFTILIFLGLFLFSCGSKEVKKDKKITEDTTTVKKEPGPDKSYLKKRPEEFKEFFMLTDVVPFTGRVATKKDVKSKDAVFNLNGKKESSHSALRIRLPFYAFLIQPDKKPSKFIAVIQAETLRGDTILGYKEANGLFGICKPRELEYFEVQKDNVYKTLQ
jgi:hypothetical protein